MRLASILSSTAAVAVVAMSSLPASGVLIYGTTDTGNLLRFDSATPGTILNSKPLSGLNVGETVVGIDFRPNDLNETLDNVDETGDLYGITNHARLVKISTNFSGVTIPVTTVGSNPVLVSGLNGSEFGFDFNPTIDRIRVVSETDDNYVVNPNTGVATVATSLFYAAGDPNAGANPNIVGSAYDNNDRNSGTGSQLYGIDSALNILVKQANSAGTLTTVGSLGWNPTAVIGFDIAAGTNVAYSAMIAQDALNNTVSNLYTVDLATGANTLVGQINGGLHLTTLTVAVPEPTTLTAASLAMLGLARRRRQVA